MSLIFLNTWYTQNRTVFVLLCLGDFTEQNVFGVHPHCSVLDFPSFLKLNKFQRVRVCVCVCACARAPTHLDAWVLSTFWLLWVMPVRTFLSTYLFKFPLPVPVWLCLEAGLLDGMMILRVTFWDTAIPFSVVNIPFYDNQPRMRAPTSPHPHYHLFPLMGVKSYLVVCICISLTIKDVECLLMCLLAICTSSLEKCLSKPLGHF